MTAQPTTATGTNPQRTVHVTADEVSLLTAGPDYVALLQKAIRDGRTTDLNIEGTTGGGKTQVSALALLGRHLDKRPVHRMPVVSAESLPPVPLSAWSPASREETERILRDAQRAMARRHRARRRFDWGTAAMVGIVLGAVASALFVVLTDGPDVRVGAIAGVAVLAVSAWGRMRAHGPARTTTDKRP
ncbi:hypothetical protein [Micromonospora chalcea]|uniref:hypothetical protein n=1 Tax=Micromonospora chalcea TaxID=1874 RepID=UPI003D744276